MKALTRIETRRQTQVESWMEWLTNPDQDYEMVMKIDEDGIWHGVEVYVYDHDHMFSCNDNTVTKFNIYPDVLAAMGLTPDEKLYRIKGYTIDCQTYR